MVIFEMIINFEKIEHETNFGFTHEWNRKG
jgi:hypothetical protein